MEGPAPHVDARLLVCYHAIFGIREIRADHLGRLDKWPAFRRAHFENGKNIRRLIDFFAEFHYVLDAFKQHDFLEEYRDKFGSTVEYKRAGVTTHDGITGLRCLEEAMRMGGGGAADATITAYIAASNTPGAPIFPITRALDERIKGWLYRYWSQFDPLVDRTEEVLNTDPDLLRDPVARGPREGGENVEPPLPSADSAPPTPATRAHGQQPRGGTLLSPRAPRAHLPTLLHDLRQLNV